MGGGLVTDTRAAKSDQTGGRACLISFAGFEKAGAYDQCFVVSATTIAMRQKAMARLRVIRLSCSSRPALPLNEVAAVVPIWPVSPSFLLSCIVTTIMRPIETKNWTVHSTIQIKCPTLCGILGS